jgi:CheY-like chemotaxis protein
MHSRRLAADPFARPAPKTMKRSRGLVLVAESDRKFLERVSSLVRSEGFYTVTTTFGRDVISLAAFHQPQLIALDIEFPDADGRDLLQAIKRDPRIAHIPVLMWSERDYDSDRRIATELGADYVPKWDPLRLMHELTRLMSARRQDGR